jgi:hypothetical protein
VRERGEGLAGDGGPAELGDLGDLGLEVGGQGVHHLQRLAGVADPGAGVPAVLDLVLLAQFGQGSSRVLSHTTSVTVRLKVVAMEPSKDVVASRFGRKATPSGVVTVSGPLTSVAGAEPASIRRGTRGRAKLVREGVERTARLRCLEVRP